MQQEESPCNNNCKMDDKLNVCVSCLRTMDEIESWNQFSKTDKEIIYKTLEKRKAVFKEFKDKDYPDLSSVF